MAVLRTVLSVGFFGAQVAAWVILLGGTGAAHSSCVDLNANGGRNPQLLINPFDANPYLLDPYLFERATGNNIRRLLGRAEDVCSSQMSLAWWITWFEFICIVLAILVASVSVLSRFADTVVGFFVGVTTIMMYQASQANDAIFARKDSNNSDVKDYVAGLRAALAGMVMTMILNFIYIICTTESSCALSFHLGCGSARSNPSTTVCAISTTTEIPVEKTGSAPPTVAMTSLGPAPATPVYNASGV